MPRASAPATAGGSTAAAAKGDRELNDRNPFSPVRIPVPEMGTSKPRATDEPECGWAKPVGARSAHYYEQGNQHSLCGKWWYHGSRYSRERFRQIAVKLCKTCAGYAPEEP